MMLDHAPAHPEFEALVARIRACTACAGLPLGPRPIFQAHPAARILIAGQAPGRVTHAKGQPFDDVSGDRLRAWLGVTREQFYDPRLFAIVPMGFCFPGTGEGGDLPPRPECAPLWHPPLLARMPRIALTLLLGRHALLAHRGLGDNARLQDIAADWRAEWPYRLTMPHPSPRNRRWLVTNPWFEAETLPALRARVAGLLCEAQDAGETG